MTSNIQVLAWDRHTYVAGLNRLIRSQPSPLGNTDINQKRKLKKTLNRFASTQKVQILSQK
jgi:hypothetical protein